MQNDDLFYTGGISQAVSSMKEGISNWWNKKVSKNIRGVTPGGEEFIVKYDRMLKGAYKRPNFITGTMQQLSDDSLDLD